LAHPTIEWLRRMSRVIKQRHTDIGEERAELLLTRIEKIFTLYYAARDEGGECELPSPPPLIDDWLEGIGEILDALERIYSSTERCYKKTVVNSGEARAAVYLGASIQLAVSAYIAFALQPTIIHATLALIGLAPVLAAFAMPHYRSASSLLLILNTFYYLVAVYLVNPGLADTVILTTLLLASLITGFYRLTKWN